MKITHLLLPILWQLCSGANPPPSWYKYVRAPPSRIISPVAILNTTGNVTNPQALITHQGVTTLSRPKTSSVIPSITLDFGLNIVGFPQLSFAGASSNHPGIKLAFSETTQYLTNVSDFTRSDNSNSNPITSGTDQFAVPSQPSNWTDTYGCLHPSTTQVCADGLHGFRYLHISLDALSSDSPYTSPNGTVVLHSLTLNFTAFLGTPSTFTGFFECSDANLTQYWFDAAYTNEMVADTFLPLTVDPRDADSPSLDGRLVLFDGAKRDRDPYVGDLAVSARTAYLTHGQLGAAVRTVLGDLAAHQRDDGWIPPASINDYGLPLFDYPLWWVVVGWEYVLYTGDKGFAKGYYANLKAVMDGFYPGVTAGNGLLEKGLNGTDGYGDYAFLPRTGQVAYYNALYVLALTSAASWAGYVGDGASAGNWTARAGKVGKAMNAVLWDGGVGAYSDTPAGSGQGVFHPQDGNGIAVLAGVANRSRAVAALSYLDKHTALNYGNAFYDAPLPGIPDASQRVYAFISFFEMQAKFGVNMTDAAIAEVRRLYGWMTGNDPGVTMWEGVGEGGSKYEGAYTSCAHGWSTGVVGVLSNYVLGVRPLSPGFGNWTVKPYLPSGVTWAQGEVGTPFGPVTVQWTTQSNGAALTVGVVSPNTTVGVVAVPVVKGQNVYLDGKKVSVKAGTDGYVSVEGLNGGNHTVEVR